MVRIDDPENSWAPSRLPTTTFRREISEIFKYSILIEHSVIDIKVTRLVGVVATVVKGVVCCVVVAMADMSDVCLHFRLLRLDDSENHGIVFILIIDHLISELRQ